MANTLLTIDMITNEALAVLENELTFTKQVNREYDDYFAKSGAKIGNTLNIRKPVRYVTRTGPSLQVQNSTETFVPVTLTQKGCDISFSSKDMTLSIDEFSDRFIVPQLATVANTIDYDGMSLYQDVPSAVGTPGTTPASLNVWLNAGVKLDNNAAPKDGNRAAVMNSQAQATLVNSLLNTFNPTNTISDQYLNGNMGRAAGFKFNMDQNVRTHTAGTYAGTITVATTSVSGATTVALSGFTAGNTFNKGDIFTIGSVFGVNPQSRDNTGQLQQFVVTATATADGSGNMTVNVSPAIVNTGDPTTNQDQTVTALPQSGASVTPFFTSGQLSPQNLVFHRDAFTLATADLIMPGGVDMAARKRGKQLNIPMRAVRAYDINNDRLPMRIDVLYGWATIRQELAARVAG